MAIAVLLARCPSLAGYDLHVDGRLDLGVEPDGEAVGAEGLDGGVQVDAAPVDGGAAGPLDRVGDLRGRDRPEQASLLAGLGGDRHLQGLEVAGDGAGLLQVGDLAGGPPCPDALGLPDRAGGGQAGQVAGQQVVAPVPVGDVDNVAGRPHPPDLLVQDDLHVRGSYRIEYGSRAISRAFLTAEATSRWCWAQLPVTRRARILPRSLMNLRSRLTSL